MYDIITYIVSYADGVTGTVFDTEIVAHGDDAVLPEPPVHDGYTFTGWVNDGKNITADITITALYEKDSTPTPTPTTPPGDVLTGDANDDGKINTADAVVVLKSSAGMITLDGNQLIAGDTNHDGKVNTADAVLILKYAAGMITEF